MQVLEAYLVRDSLNSDPASDNVPGGGRRDAFERTLLYLCSLLSAEITLRPDGNGTVLLEGTVRDIPVGQPIDEARICFLDDEDCAATDAYGRFRLQSISPSRSLEVVRIHVAGTEVRCALPTRDVDPSGSGTT